MYCGGVVKSGFEWVRSVKDSLFENGKVELIGCSRIESDGSERVECSVRVHRGCEVASVLCVVLLCDDPSSVKIGDPVEVLDVGNECS